MTRKTGLLAFLVLLACTLPLWAGAETQRGKCGGNLTWSLTDDGALTISGSGDMYDYYYIEKEGEDGYVTTAPWSSSPTTVTIEEGVTSIGKYAFLGCAGLTGVTLPDGVTSIGEGAFLGCVSLTGVTIPDSVIYIKNGAFSECESLTSVTIPYSVTSIGEGAFANCYSLMDVTIGNGVTSIGKHAFYCCGLTGVTIPDSVTSIGEYAFCTCPMTSVTIGNGVTSIGEYAFCDCTSLTSVTIGNSVTSIGEYAFCDCYSLTSVTLGNSVTGIGEKAFCYCTSLTSVSLPDSLTSIGARAFEHCSGVKRITIPDGVTSIGERTFYECTSLMSVTIGNSVSSIGEYAFYECKSLTSIALGNSVTSIGDHAFESCSLLKSVAIPDSVISIGPSAFADCCCLKSVVIPDGVTAIGESVFYRCFSLTSVTIPGSVTSIGYGAFLDCSALTAVTIPVGVTSIGAVAFDGCSALTAVTIPDSVTSIGEGAFALCGNLARVTIGNGVTSIDEFAFYNCISLTDVTIPGGVTSISRGVFEGCSSLTNVTIPDGVTDIEGFAFYQCDSLTDVTIPASVTSIGEKAFASCSSLRRAAFLLRGRAKDFSCSLSAFDQSTPMIYCYKQSSVDDWAVSNIFPVTYFDDIIVEGIQILTLPGGFRLPVGGTRQINAYLFPDCGEVITWSSSNPAVARVENGLVTALDTGTAVITAETGTDFSSIAVEVFIPATMFELNKTEAWAETGSQMPLSVASYVPSYASADISWGSTDESRAAVSKNGLVTAKNPGDVTITAVSESGVLRECLIHVCHPVTNVTLTASRNRMIVGHDLWLNACVTTSAQTYVNRLVTFTSSDTNVATVDSETGLVHAAALGSVTITAASASGKTASFDITVVERCIEHTPVVDEAVAPTCTETGLTQGSHCEKCGEILTAQEEIPALNHEWGEEIVYVWAQDDSAVTACRVCVRNAEHTLDLETVPVVRRVATVSPTEDAEGAYNIVSGAFKNEACEVQEKAGGAIPALGSLDVLALPRDLKEIGDEAFFADLICQAVVIPDGCRSIGLFAFADCTSLVYVRVPASVKEIPESAFSNCPLVIVDWPGW